MSIKDAAEKIGVAYWTVLRMVKKGEIPSAKKGGRYVVSAKWVADKVTELAALQ